MIPSIGIDPSLSNLAVCVLNGGSPAEQSFGSKCPENKTLGQRVSRYRNMVNEIAGWIAEASPSGVVFIEGYSFGSRQSLAHQAGEFGMFLRCRLLMHRHTIVEVPPAKLKQWATGKGNAKKAAVVSALSKRYGRDDLVTDDKADAFALAKLGSQVLGNEAPDTEFQAKAKIEVERLYIAELKTLPW